MDNFQDFLLAHSIDKKDLVLDSTFRNLKTEKFKGWYIGEESDGKYRVTFCDWRTKDRQTFSEGFTDKDNRAAQKRFKELEVERKALQERKKEDVRKSWEAMHLISAEYFQHPGYLKRKKIDQLFGAFGSRSHALGFDAIVPMYNENDEICNMQRIQEDGFKSFVPGAEVDGLFFELISPQGNGSVDLSVVKDSAKVILICEGFATAASVQLAFPQYRVVCAFSAGNLEAVAITYRLRFPDSMIVIAGDNDWHLPEKGEANAGLEAAMKAANTVLGSWIVPKDFPSHTDWNDWHCSAGLAYLRDFMPAAFGHCPAISASWLKQFISVHKSNASENHSQQADAIKDIINGSNDALNSIGNRVTGVTAHEPGLVPLPLKTNKQGKVELPPDPVVVDALLEYFGPRILKCDETLFQYKDNYWKALEPFEEHRIHLMLSTLMDKEANTGKIEACFRLFKRSVTQASRNMFEPQVSIVNFLNGTLHIEYRNGKWGTRFAAHRAEDLCTNIISIAYEESSNEKAVEFEAMLDRILAHDSETERTSKLRAIKQMYGACLAPMFPHLFLFHGKGGTGKTSLVIPAQKLVGQKNLSAVDPSEFEGFNLESMIGKTVNISLDIDTQNPIADAVIKRIEDRLPVRINRKFQTAVLAPLPAVHIFVGNKIPATYEKGSGAHRRRWTFIEINGFQAEGNYSKSFAHDVFEAEKAGILRFAVDGLMDLLRENGHFFVPDSSKKAMRSWEMENDSVALFVQELIEGEVNGLCASSEGSMPRITVWKTFCDWFLESYNTKPRLGKTKFYEAFLGAKIESAQGAKFELATVRGVRNFRGVATLEAVIKSGAM